MGHTQITKQKNALKDIPKKEDKIVILGGENYRIGMGGAARY
jgi:phosphoribosylformylglycinamidine synthase